MKFIEMNWPYIDKRSSFFLCWMDEGAFVCDKSLLAVKRGLIKTCFPIRLFEEHEIYQWSHTSWFSTRMKNLSIMNVHMPNVP